MHDVPVLTAGGRAKAWCLSIHSIPMLAAGARAKDWCLRMNNATLRPFSIQLSSVLLPRLRPTEPSELNTRGWFVCVAPCAAPEQGAPPPRPGSDARAVGGAGGSTAYDLSEHHKLQAGPYILLQLQQFRSLGCPLQLQ